MCLRIIYVGYVSATVSGHLPRTSNWPTGCTWFFMRLHIKNDEIPAARSMLRLLNDNKNKTQIRWTKTEKNGTENNKLLCGCWPSLVPLPPSLSPSVSLNLSLSISICVPVSFPACLRRLGLIFDSSIINHTLTFHTVRTVVAVAATLENPGNLLTTYLTVRDCLVQTILTVCLVSEHFLSNNVLSSFRLGFQMGQSI